MPITLVAQGGPVIFPPPKVSHLGWLGGHIWINYPYINVNYEKEKLWGGKYYRTPSGTRITSNLPSLVMSVEY